LTVTKESTNFNIVLIKPKCCGNAICLSMYNVICLMMYVAQYSVVLALLQGPTEEARVLHITQGNISIPFKAKVQKVEVLSDDGRSRS
jgi:hypothetical protein